MTDYDKLLARFHDLQNYIGWTAEDARRVADLRSIVTAHFAAIVDDFYRAIGAHTETRVVISGGDEQIQRLRGTLHAWLGELFSGTYDGPYVLRRWRVGLRHVEIGLEQQFTNVAMGRVRSHLIQIVCESWTGSTVDLASALLALNRLLDLDLAIIESAYQYEHTQRQKRAERLIAIGQMASGIAHELRNPLNVVRTSVFYLQNARRPTPEKQAEHLERIQRQVSVADGVITALSDFAKLPLPHTTAIPVRTLIDETLTHLSVPTEVRVEVNCGEDLPPVLGDFRQLFIVLSNLARNALDAMPQGGTLTFSAERLGGRVALAVADTGQGIAPDDLQRIFEPFFSTKVRGIGLGLAISRAIVDNHRGELQVTSEPGRGSRFCLLLTAAPEQ